MKYKKVLDSTSKRVSLVWFERTVEATIHWTPTGAMGHLGVTKKHVVGFGSIDYAVKFLNEGERGLIINEGTEFDLSRPPRFIMIHGAATVMRPLNEQIIES